MSDIQEPKRRNLFALLPLALFAALAAVFYVSLHSGKDPQALPSALLGQTAPQTNLPAIEGVSLPGFSNEDFKGKVTLLNVFASWCVPCRDEHPVLLELAKDPRFQLIGMNYKDKPDHATVFLTELGSPYSKIGSDQSGRAGIDWGVYGVPETYVIGKDGTIRYKQVGPLDGESVKVLLAEVEKASGDSP